MGAYPDLSLKQAREQRDDLRARIAQGIDPRIHRLQTKAAAPSNAFAAVFKSCGVTSRR